AATRCCGGKDCWKAPGAWTRTRSSRRARLRRSIACIASMPIWRTTLSCARISRGGSHELEAGTLDAGGARAPGAARRVVPVRAAGQRAEVRDALARGDARRALAAELQLVDQHRRHRHRDL